MNACIGTIIFFLTKILIITLRYILQCISLNLLIQITSIKLEKESRINALILQDILYQVWLMLLDILKSIALSIL